MIFLFSNLNIFLLAMKFEPKSFDKKYMFQRPSMSFTGYSGDYDFPNKAGLDLSGKFVKT